MYKSTMNPNNKWAYDHIRYLPYLQYILPEPFSTATLLS